jgi:hypothetical protein
MIPKISLSENAIHVKNAFVNFKISIQDISYVEKVEKLGLNIRTFGAGGVFVYQKLLKFIFNQTAYSFDTFTERLGENLSQNSKACIQDQ